MREIKFRGKRVDNGEWVYGYYAQDIDYAGPKTFKYTDCIISAKKDNAEGNWFEVGSETIGQFTGLKDKAGREIYDGDKVHAVNKSGWGAELEIMWNEDRAGFMVWKGDDPSLSFELTCDTLIDYKIEVVGNIHEATP